MLKHCARPFADRRVRTTGRGTKRHRTLYDVYESKAHLDAVCVDIRSELDRPASYGSVPQITVNTGFPASGEPERQPLARWQLVRMADEAPTLKDLRALPPPGKHSSFFVGSRLNTRTVNRLLAR